MATAVLDDPRLGLGVAQPPPEPGDGTCKATVLDMHVRRPARLKELVSRDNLLSMLDEIAQNLEQERRERDRFLTLTAGEFTTGDVKLVLTEDVAHTFPPLAEIEPSVDGVGL
jgi:hypothetical protein